MGMEYVYAALLLHKAGHKVEEGALGKVLEAVGMKADIAMSKAVVASLDGVDIEKAIKEAAMAAPMAMAAAPAGHAPAAKEEKKEEKKPVEDAAAGLGSLFG